MICCALLTTSEYTASGMEGVRLKIHMNWNTSHDHTTATW